MEKFYNKHYIRIREDGCIVDGFSDAFREPTDTDICINEQGGYQFRLFPGGEENPSLFEWDGMVPLYKWEGGEVVTISTASKGTQSAFVLSSTSELSRRGPIGIYCNDTIWLSADL